MRVPVTLFTLVFVLLLRPASARAELIDLGDGTVYSTDLGLMLLKDMNTARTSGYDGDGLMLWADAMRWVDSINAGSHLGYSDWTLAGGFGTDWHGTESVYEYLFYEELGNTRPSHLGYTGMPAGFNAGPFTNIGTGALSGYWIATQQLGYGHAVEYEVFRDVYDGPPWALYASAMRRSAPPAGIPEPSTWLMIGLGALFIARWRHARRAPA